MGGKSEVVEVELEGGGGGRGGVGGVGGGAGVGEVGGGGGGGEVEQEEVREETSLDASTSLRLEPLKDYESSEVPYQKTPSKETMFLKLKHRIKQLESSLNLTNRSGEEGCSLLSLWGGLLPCWSC